MTTEKSLLKKYRELLDSKTFLAMSKDSGINLSRLFRLENGYEMTLKEYKIIKSRIATLLNQTRSIEYLAQECMEKLSPISLREIEIYLIRRLETYEISKNESRKYAISI